jgi:hypothetical protein
MGHINLRVTHRLLFRLYGFRAIVSIISGLGIMFLPAAFVGSSNYSVITSVIPLTVTGVLFLLFGLMIAGALFKLPYKVARLGIGGTVLLYFLWGMGILTNNIFNQAEITSLFAVFAYFSLATTSFFMLLEPPINPETAIRTNREK